MRKRWVRISVRRSQCRPSLGAVVVFDASESLDSFNVRRVLGVRVQLWRQQTRALEKRGTDARHATERYGKLD